MGTNGSGERTRTTASAAYQDSPQFRGAMRAAEHARAMRAAHRGLNPLIAPRTARSGGRVRGGRTRGV